MDNHEPHAERQHALATTVLDAVEEAILFLAPDGRLALTNRCVEALLGLRPDDVVGKPAGVVHQAIADGFEECEAFLEALRDLALDPSRTFGMVVATDGPDRRELGFQTRPVVGPDGEVLGRVYIFRDVTRFRELDRLKSDTVNMVAHELRSPLSSIQGYASLMLDEDVGDLSQTQAEFLAVIQRNARRLATLVNTWLDLTRLEAGMATVRCEPVDLAQVVELVAATLRPQIRAKDQELVVDLGVRPATVLGDHDALVQVATNLLSNAHKHTPAGGTLRLSAADDGDGGIRLDVLDTGVGLSEDDQARLFTKFFRARRTESERGTGLGLSLTKQLVERMGGRIAVSSRLGLGSVSLARPAAADQVSTDERAAVAA